MMRTVQAPAKQTLAHPGAMRVVVASLMATLLAAATACGSDSRAAAVPCKIVAATASSAAEGYPAAGAANGDRFAAEPGAAWKGAPGEKHWTWTADLGATTSIGAILLVWGDGGPSFGETPIDYKWEVSADGTSWRPLGSKPAADRRMFRIERWSKAPSGRFVRLTIDAPADHPPALREVEVYADPAAVIPFPDWFIVLNSFDVPSTDTCDQFLTLAQKCAGWEKIQAQFLWHGYLITDFATAEPRPLCVFYTGSFADWCQVDPATWQATGELLKDASLPTWAACGGAQALGLLSDAKSQATWDCPKCRDPNHPKSPIYGHIGLLDASVKAECGDYSNNVYERGPTRVRRVGADPVFAGLPEEFEVPEYHCGQLEYLPAGWELVATKGSGGKTWMQCMRKQGTAIYAAQFHIELDGAAENSIRIMSNFLAYAKEWQANRVAMISPPTSPSSAE